MTEQKVKSKKAEVQSEPNELEQKLKKQYGTVHKITFVVEGKQSVAYLREPELAELDATLSSLQTAPISSSVGLFRNTFVGGDQELLDLAGKTGYAIAINKEIQSIIPLVHSTSTKV